MTRMTAARLAEIESATRYESGNRNPVVQAVYKELLAELREVTRERDAYKRAKEENDEHFMRERDEARAERDEARADYRDHDEYLHNCHKLLKEAGHHVAQGAIDGIHSLINERDKLKQELADLNNDAGNEYAIVMHYKGEMERLAAKVESLEEFYDIHVGDALEADDLRAENAKLKAVVAAAMECLHHAPPPNDLWAPPSKLKGLRDALAALDPKEGA